MKLGNCDRRLKELEGHQGTGFLGHLIRYPPVPDVLWTILLARVVLFVFFENPYFEDNFTMGQRTCTSACGGI